MSSKTKYMIGFGGLAAVGAGVGTSQIYQLNRITKQKWNKSKFSKVILQMINFYEYIFN